MTDPITLLALAERCEHAAGPDRELDAEISVAVGRHETHVERRSDGTTKLLPWRGDGTGSYNIDCRRYTASLDAAVTLAPDGWRWWINSSPFARCWLVANDRIVDKAQSEKCATPALALCAAALRARVAAYE
jgi:hypothetical protein